MVLGGDGTFIVGNEAIADWKLLGNRLILQVRSSRKSNGELAVFEVTCRDGSGLEGWYQWLRDMRAGKL